MSFSVYRRLIRVFDVLYRRSVERGLRTGHLYVQMLLAVTKGNERNVSNYANLNVSRNFEELEPFVGGFRVKLVKLLFSKYYLTSFVNVVLP